MHGFTFDNFKKMRKKHDTNREKIKTKKNRTKKNTLKTTKNQTKTQFHTLQALITDTRPKNMMDLLKRKVLIQSHQVCYS